jgi:hypothetical protein
MKLKYRTGKWQIILYERYVCSTLNSEAPLFPWNIILYFLSSYDYIVSWIYFVMLYHLLNLINIVTCYLLTRRIICGLRILYLDLLDLHQAVFTIAYNITQTSNFFWFLFSRNCCDQLPCRTLVTNSCGELFWWTSIANVRDELLLQTPMADCCDELLGRTPFTDFSDLMNCYGQTASIISPSSSYNLGDQLLSIVGLFVATIHACWQTVTKLQQFPIVAVAKLVVSADT